MKKNPRVAWFQSQSLLRALCVLAIACLAIQGIAQAQTWNLAWSDEFDGTAIDTSKWAFDHGNLNVNNEIEYYCGPAGDPANQSPCSAQNPNAYLDGSGHLVIQAFRINSNTGPYSNSWISTAKPALLSSSGRGRRSGWMCFSASAAGVNSIVNIDR